MALWARTGSAKVASHSSGPRFDVTTIEINAAAPADGETYLLRATNTQLRFAGFRQVYSEARDDDTEEPLSARILAEEHRIYPEAIRIVLSGRFRIDGRRVILT